MSRTEARDTFGRPQQDGFWPDLCYLVELHIQSREHLRPFSLQTPTTFGVGCCLEYIFFPSYPCQNCYQTDILSERLLPAGPILEQRFDAKESFPRKTQNCPALCALPFYSLHHLTLTHRKEVCHTITCTPVCEQRREKERTSGGFLN